MTKKTGVRPVAADSSELNTLMDIPHASRVIITRVNPEIDGGLFPIKRCLGDKVRVEAIIISDGHDKIKGDLLYKAASENEWSSIALVAGVNDLWSAEFPIMSNEDYVYTVTASMDRFGTWSGDFIKRLEAHEVEEVHLQVGIEILKSWLSDLSKEDSGYITGKMKDLRNLYVGADTDVAKFKNWLEEPELLEISHSVMDSENHQIYPKDLKVQVDPVYAGFSSWYEFFPRSFGEDGKHGTFKTAKKMLNYVAGLGFDVIYLPPIHPIGHEYRKGKNNSLKAEDSDVGSPWAIGSKDGGHKSIEPKLGSFADFESFVNEAKAKGMRVALDIAYQCSPDHPWVSEHPEWFKKRPDGSIQYAENPPKKYQDIYPIDFDSSDWRNLWIELKSVIDFWIDKGIQIFRVDNPHTKSFAFWQWALAEIRKAHPEVIFLAEAFTRPNLMSHLAKIGYHQSYTYFTWRNTKKELTQYMTELSQTEMVDYFRPNFWPNTPDILSHAMHYSGENHFRQRLILAATLSPNFGVYGPAYELMQNMPYSEHKEEYLDSEKYQLKSWQLNSPGSLAPLMKRLNEIRQREKAFQNLRSIEFLEIGNDQLLAYSKRSAQDDQEITVTVVNLDLHNTQIGQLIIPLEKFGISEGHAFQAHDLLSDQKYLWWGPYQYIEINPYKMPAHIFKIKRRLKNEQDFDYYL